MKTVESSAVFQPKQWAEKEAGKTIENRTKPELVPNQASKSNIVRGAHNDVLKQVGVVAPERPDTAAHTGSQPQYRTDPYPSASKTQRALKKHRRPRWAERYRPKVEARSLRYHRLRHSVAAVLSTQHSCV